MPSVSKLSMLKSSYLNLIYNHDICKIFTKIRTGYNILNVSIGRFKNLNSNFCNNCLTKIETVEHFLLDSAEVSDFISEVLLLSPSLATPNYRSSIATIKSSQIHIRTWFINSLASSPLDK